MIYAHRLDMTQTAGVIPSVSIHIVLRNIETGHGQYGFAAIADISIWDLRVKLADRINYTSTAK